MNIILLTSIGVVGIGVLTFFYHKGKEAENKTITYSQFTEQLSRQIDNYMLDEEKKKKVIIYGGECEISIPKDDPDNVVMEITIYSKKENNDKWLKNNITQKLAVSEFSDDPDTISKIQSLRNQPEKFKVTKPEKE